MPLLSIIVPVYNKERYISDCLNSILSQTFTNYELILVDDGSTDKSGIICNEYKLMDSRIVVIQQVNRGVSEARNTGLHFAQGEYIGFIDSDDIIHESMFEILVKNIANNKADISGCGMNVIQGNNVKKGSSTNVVSLYDNDEGLSVYLKGKLERSANNKIYRASLIKSLKFEGAIFEDVLFCFEAFCKASRTVYLDWPLYFYEIRDNSVSVSKFDARYMQALYVTNKIVNVVQQNKEKHLNDAKTYDLSVNIFVLNLILFSSKEKFTDEYNRVAANLKNYSNFVGSSRSLSIKNRLAYYLFEFSPMIYYYAILVYCIVFRNEVVKRKAD